MVEQLVLPETYLAMPRWWDGRDGAWLAALPATVERQCRHWGLRRDGAVTHGSNALAVPVRRGDEALMLRLFPPAADAEEEVAALRFWDGRGTARLVDADLTVAAMLLERLIPGTTAAQLPVGAGLAVLGRMMRRLAVPPPDAAPHTAALAAERGATLHRDWLELGKPFAADIVRAAERAAAELSTARADLAVDGDLHADQVLRATREPWLTVDLVLYRGDPEYNLGRMLADRVEEMPTDADVRGHLATVVREAGLDPARAHTWAVFRAVDYWLWALQDGLTIDPRRCARLVAALGTELPVQ